MPCSSSAPRQSSSALWPLWRRCACSGCLSTRRWWTSTWRPTPSTPPLYSWPRPQATSRSASSPAARRGRTAAPPATRALGRSSRSVRASPSASPPRPSAEAGTSRRRRRTWSARRVRSRSAGRPRPRSPTSSQRPLAGSLPRSRSRPRRGDPLPPVSCNHTARRRGPLAGAGHATRERGPSMILDCDVCKRIGAGARKTCAKEERHQSNVQVDRRGKDTAPRARRPGTFESEPAEAASWIDAMAYSSGAPPSRSMSLPTSCWILASIVSSSAPCARIRRTVAARAACSSASPGVIADTVACISKFSRAIARSARVAPASAGAAASNSARALARARATAAIVSGAATAMAR
mmetsp:Transcript_5017/g.17760  ORF Transcript_5017/g.17760 Transcript_5017/m.17760 type:complete len:351 (-) Transcript_5017:704-1756(-)